jgi:hypothetical protein
LSFVRRISFFASREGEMKKNPRKKSVTTLSAEKKSGRRERNALTEFATARIKAGEGVA